MALINCPNCDKEISSKSKTCIHCGFTLSKKISKRKKAFILIVSAFILITCSFIISKALFNQSESSDILEQLLKSESIEDIKNLFGENHETINHYETSSKTEFYHNFKINDLDCSQLTLFYDNNTYTGYDCELINIDAQHLNIIKQKLIEVFGNSYNYNPMNDQEIYFWKKPPDKTISLTILKDSDTESYYLHIVNV